MFCCWSPWASPEIKRTLTCVAEGQLEEEEEEEGGKAGWRGAPCACHLHRDWGQRAPAERCPLPLTEPEGRTRAARSSPRVAPARHLHKRATDQGTPGSAFPTPSEPRSRGCLVLGLRPPLPPAPCPRASEAPASPLFLASRGRGLSLAFGKGRTFLLSHEVTARPLSLPSQLLSPTQTQAPASLSGVCPTHSQRICFRRS